MRSINTTMDSQINLKSVTRHKLPVDKDNATINGYKSSILENKRKHVMKRVNKPSQIHGNYLNQLREESKKDQTINQNYVKTHKHKRKVSNLESIKNKVISQQTNHVKKKLPKMVRLKPKIGDSSSNYNNIKAKL